tara:strand:- start:835 stop:1665 length:831 start_codon:yes stop_codon:yes gene_type:complete
MNRLYFSKKLRDFFFHTSSNRQNWKRRLIGKNIYAHNNVGTLVHIRLDNKLASYNFQSIPDNLEVDLTDMNYFANYPLTNSIILPLTAGGKSPNFFKTRGDIVFDLDKDNKVVKGKIDFGGDYITTPTLQYEEQEKVTPNLFNIINHKPNRFVSFYLPKGLAASFYGKNMWSKKGPPTLVYDGREIAITFPETDAGGIESISIPVVEVTDKEFGLLIQPQRAALPYMNYDFFCVVSDDFMLYRQLDYPFTDFFIAVRNLLENELVVKYLKKGLEDC